MWLCIYADRRGADHASDPSDTQRKPLCVNFFNFETKYLQFSYIYDILPQISLCSTLHENKTQYFYSLVAVVVMAYNKSKPSTINIALYQSVGGGMMHERHYVVSRGSKRAFLLLHVYPSSSLLSDNNQSLQQQIILNSSKAAKEAAYCFDDSLSAD